MPTNPPRSIREISVSACELAGAPAPRLSPMPRAVLWLGGLNDPIVRELRETQYQFRNPFVLDSSAAQETFGLEPAPLELALAETVAGLRDGAATAHGADAAVAVEASRRRN